MLRIQSICISYWFALKLYLLGFLYNNCFPGSIGGDVLRAWYVTKHTDKKIEAAMSVFVDRTIGMACTIAIVFLAYWLIPKGSAETQFSLGVSFSLASPALKFLLAFFILTIIVLTIMYYSKKLRPILWFDRILTSLKLYCTRPFIMLLAILLTFFCQSMSVYGLYLVGKNLGIEANARYYFMFFPLSWIIGIIPISIGGTGVTELGLKGLFGKVTQITEIQGLILALTQRLTWLLTSIPGFFIHLTCKHLPDEEKSKADIGWLIMIVYLIFIIFVM
jgi:uncharacterized protein (TIRG00374 family)